MKYNKIQQVHMMQISNNFENSILFITFSTTQHFLSLQFECCASNPNQCKNQVHEGTKGSNCTTNTQAYHNRFINECFIHNISTNI